MKKAVVLLVLALGLLLRVYGLDKTPPSLFFDEADLGYQAYSMMLTGEDYFGDRLPVSFHSFADFRASLYIYSSVITIKLFGLNEWGVRVPAAIFGVLSLLVFFLLIKEISGNFNFSIIATLFLTIFPWHFFYSRAGFEVTLFFFLLCLGLWLFFLSLRKKSFSFLLFSLFSFSLTLYAYATARMFVPLLGFCLLLIYRKEIFGFGGKKVLLGGLFVLVLITPFVRDSLSGRSMFRFSYINIFYDSNLKYEIDRQRLIDSVHGRTQVVGMKPTFTSYIFHNKPLFWFWEIITNYFSAYSSNFLFISGDPNLRQGVGKMGNLLVFTAPLLILGIIKSFLAVKEKNSKAMFSQKSSLFLLVYFLIAPLPSSITFDGGTHATRLFLSLLPLVVFISLGFFEILEWFKRKGSKILVAGFVLVLIGLNFIYYLHIYFYHFPIDSEKYWQVGFKEGMQQVWEKESGYDKVIMTNSYEPPLVFFLFWSKFDPNEFRATKLGDVSNGWFEGKKFKKYYFGKLTTAFVDSYLKSILTSVEEPEKEERILVLSGRNDFGVDLEKNNPFGLRVVSKTYLNSGEPILYLLESVSWKEMKEIKEIKSRTVMINEN